MGTPSTPSTAVAALEAVFGPASDAGFGSATFTGPTGADLEPVARATYRRFVGAKWERFGEAAWMGPWRRVYARPAGAARDVVAELAALPDREARSSAGAMVDGLEDAARGKAALAAAFDATDVTRFEVYNAGDGEAMSGVVLVGARGPADPVTIVAFLLD
ncbi:MAG: hypothetical protein JNM10_09755 [Planctomycetia bacterium]|nr:hypothetical protein [Planctomycetia bacterium]